jgi:hypothetical protein
VGIAVRKDDDVPCAEMKRPTVSFDMGIAAAFGQQVIDDHVSAFWEKIRGHGARGGCTKAPGRGIFRIVKQGSVKLDGLEDFG